MKNLLLAGGLSGKRGRPPSRSSQQRGCRLGEQGFTCCCRIARVPAGECVLAGGGSLTFRVPQQPVLLSLTLGRRSPGSILGICCWRFAGRCARLKDTPFNSPAVRRRN